MGGTRLPCTAGGFKADRRGQIMIGRGIPSLIRLDAPDAGARYELALRYSQDHFAVALAETA